MKEKGETIKVRIETHEPILTNVNTAIDTEKENAVPKLLSNQISDYHSIFIGLCFYVAWAEVLVKAILLLIVFFALFKSIQLCINNFKLDIQFNIWIR